MHFKITGTEHATSARRVVECEAPNRAAAEKQAHLQGVDEIIRVEQVVDDAAQAAVAQAPRVTHRGEFPESSGKGKWVALGAVILIVIVAAAIYWARTRGT
jgi:hypothetical protein